MAIDGTAQELPASSSPLPLSPSPLLTHEPPPAPREVRLRLPNVEVDFAHALGAFVLREVAGVREEAGANWSVWALNWARKIERLVVVYVCVCVLILPYSVAAGAVSGAGGGVVDSELSDEESVASKVLVVEIDAVGPFSKISTTCSRCWSRTGQLRIERRIGKTCC
ncbi:hypothetical protein B0H34DRAFT_800554 [Crassisporium funariophilum]|nr:hypothetical protein B0H34DRAFT_800554 [Crassisporium funariophilum]